ncbi:MAG: DUF92 domain-containing protein [Spirochaetes bacterium]|nr:DUF92 domain-containing protein [Spirochaetota bacterium]
MKKSCTVIKIGYTGGGTATHTGRGSILGLSMETLIIALALNSAAGLAAYLRGAFTPGGLAAGVATGTVVYCAGGPWSWCVMGAFVVSSSLLGGYRKGEKRNMARIQEKGGRRDWLQVMSNGAVGCAMILLHRTIGGPLFLLLFAVAFASANADTWAGELGSLARRPPRSIVTFREVPRGTSGGVSVPGLLASLAGASFIALVCLGGAAACGAELPVRWVLWIAAGGFSGSVIDSLLGATVQAQYRDGSGLITERRREKGMPARLVRGFAFITNDTVNFLATLLAVAVTLAAVRLLSPDIP